jgi:uncharacterized protein (TIGR00156 family)
MKKILFLMMLGTMLSAPVYVYAKGDCPCAKNMMQSGGFVDEASATPISIAEVKKMSDDAYVTMSGYITKRLSDDTYNFTDGKDNLTVEIGKKAWRGQTITPKDKILLQGEVDKDFTSFEVKAKSISKL